MKKQKKIDYRRQSQANIQDFWSEDFSIRRKVFFKLTKKLNDNQVNWALGCSSNLFFRGIVDDFNDFDLIVDKNSIEKIGTIMKSLGAKLIATGGNGFCESDIYFHYSLDGCDIDIISGFRIKTFGTVFYYCYNSKEIEYLDLEYLQVPLITVEAQLILYAMMEGWQPRRRFKRLLIQSFLEETGITFPKILERSRNQFKLPEWINCIISEYI